MTDLIPQPDKLHKLATMARARDLLARASESKEAAKAIRAGAYDKRGMVYAREALAAIRMALGEGER